MHGRLGDDDGPEATNGLRESEDLYPGFKVEENCMCGGV